MNVSNVPEWKHLVNHVSIKMGVSLYLSCMHRKRTIITCEVWNVLLLTACSAAIAAASRQGCGFDFTFSIRLCRVSVCWRLTEGGGAAFCQICPQAVRDIVHLTNEDLPFSAGWETRQQKQTVHQLRRRRNRLKSKNLSLQTLNSPVTDLHAA